MSKTRRRQQLDVVTEALYLNGRVSADGPQRKTWTKHDLRTIKPLTPTQEDMFHDFFAGQHIVAAGSAGTGKTFCALYLAFNELLSRPDSYEKIIIVRAAVPTRDVGFVPGTLEEKVALYEMPYRDICGDLFRRASSYDDMKERGVIDFVTTSFIRGLTWDNAIIILDEVQSMNFHEISTVLTRAGDNSRIIVCGDTKQNDLLHRKTDQSGFGQFVQVVEKMGSFSILSFTKHDIVRGSFVKEWITACEELGL